jgi:hypothetical protein
VGANVSVYPSTILAVSIMNRIEKNKTKFMNADLGLYECDTV